MKYKIGDKIGSRVIIEEVGKNKYGEILLKVRCDCNREDVLVFSKLSVTLTCNSCKNRKYKLGDIVGKRKICEDIGRNIHGQLLVKVKCDCGREDQVYHNSLSRSSMCTDCARKTHGSWGTTEYTIWNGLLQRCKNPNNKGYKWYGGRGIKVCDRWLKFENFLLDMGKRPINHQLDRIDNDGDYEPNNCKWSTPKENQNNKRTSPKSKYKWKKLLITTEEFDLLQKLKIALKNISDFEDGKINLTTEEIK